MTSRALPLRSTVRLEPHPTVYRAPTPIPPPSGPVLTGDWTRWSYLELGALPSAVPCARLHARQVLWEWGHKELAEVTELVVSELATNAIRAGNLHFGMAANPVIRFWLMTDDAQVLVQVWDGSPRQPQPAQPEIEAEHGRGLLIVDALSSGWGSFTVPGWPGKVVWARCLL